MTKLTLHKTIAYLFDNYCHGSLIHMLIRAKCVSSSQCDPQEECIMVRQLVCMCTCTCTGGIKMIIFIHGTIIAMSTTPTHCVQLYAS